MSYNIINAAKDFIDGNLEFVSMEEEIRRRNICKPCEVNMAGICTACGCVIRAKAKLTKGECPLGLWDLGESDSPTVDDKLGL